MVPKAERPGYLDGRVVLLLSRLFSTAFCPCRKCYPSRMPLKSATTRTTRANPAKACNVTCPVAGKNNNSPATGCLHPDLWYARIPFGSHLTEMLALICSAYVTWKTREASSADRKYPSA